MKKILIILTQPLDPHAGGVQRNTWVISQFLQKHGYMVEIISFTCTGNQEPSGITVHSVPIEGGQAVKENQAHLVKILEVFRPNLVINQMGFDPIISSIIWRIRNDLKYKVIACYRNNPSWYRTNLRHTLREMSSNNFLAKVTLRNPLAWTVAWLYHIKKNRLLFQRSVEQSDRYMLLSPTFIDELRWYVPKLQDEQVSVIPNQFEIPETVPSDKKNSLLFLGRIEQRQKQVMLLPEVWEAIHSQLPDWILDIVGDGPDLSRLKKEFETKKLPRVKFHGKQNPTPFYQQAKIFMMLSRYEGFGNTLIEAQAEGVVPVAFDSYSAIRWILNDREDAILIKPFVIKDFYNAILSLASDEVLLNRLSRAAHENSKKYSTDNSGKKWLDVIQKLLDSDQS